MARGLNADLADKFQSYFSAPLEDFWDYFFGFDVVKFDDYMKTPPDVSLRDYLIQQYSQEASDFVAELIKILPIENLYKGLSDEEETK